MKNEDAPRQDVMTLLSHADMQRVKTQSGFNSRVAMLNPTERLAIPSSQATPRVESGTSIVSSDVEVFLSVEHRLRQVEPELRAKFPKGGDELKAAALEQSGLGKRILVSYRTTALTNETTNSHIKRIVKAIKKKEKIPPPVVVLIQTQVGLVLSILDGNHRREAERQVYGHKIEVLATTADAVAHFNRVFQDLYPEEPTTAEGVMLKLKTKETSPQNDISHEDKVTPLTGISSYEDLVDEFGVQKSP